MTTEIPTPDSKLSIHSSSTTTTTTTTTANIDNNNTDQKSFPIRHATWHDLPEMARMMGLAFFDNELFGEVIHPHRNKHPGDVHLFFLRNFEKKFFDSRTIFLVATTDVAVDEKTKREAIVGVAEWNRDGLDEEAYREGYVTRWWHIKTHLLKLLATLHSAVHTHLLRPSKAIDPTKSDILARSFPHIAHHWSPNHRSSCYNLQHLGVHPSWQSRGIGQSLVAWGIQRARQDKVAAGVVCADGTERFYHNCGFDRLVGWATEGEGNPLAGVRGGAVMFRDHRDDDDDEERQRRRKEK